MVTRNRPLTILIVDEQIEIARFIGMILMGEGHRVHIASGIDSALMHIQDEVRFDLLITDYVIDGPNGVELFLKIHDLQPNVRLIGMSADENACARFGAYTHEFLLKPFDIADLRYAVKAAVPESVSLEKDRRSHRRMIPPGGRANISIRSREEVFPAYLLNLSNRGALTALDSDVSLDPQATTILWQCDSGVLQLPAFPSRVSDNTIAFVFDRPDNSGLENYEDVVLQLLHD